MQGSETKQQSLIENIQNLDLYPAVGGHNLWQLLSSNIWAIISFRVK